MARPLKSKGSQDLYKVFIPCFIFSFTSLVFKLFCRQGSENLEEVKPHFTARHEVVPFPKAKDSKFHGATLHFTNTYISCQKRLNCECGAEKVE